MQKDDLTKHVGNVWWVEGQGAYLQRCPQCAQENYALAVASGRCYACGYNANQYPASQYPPAGLSSTAAPPPPPPPPRP